MSKLAGPTAMLLLSGCAGIGEWRALSIDGSSESAFDGSVARLNDELPPGRDAMFTLALMDVARTGAEAAGQAGDGSAYTDETFRSELDGLTYEGVIALADRSGTPIWKQYYSRAPVPTAPIPLAQPPFYGDDRFFPVSNPGLILSDSWKDIGAGQ